METDRQQEAYASVYITAASREQAVAIGRALVEQRLAACANIFDGVRSLYWWQGAVQDDAEAVLIVKTHSALLERLIDRVKQLHSYDCPCIVARPITAGNAEYLAWIDAETG